MFEGPFLFRFIALEFDYRALEPVHLAEGKATNIVRGALGLALRRQSCPPDCLDSRTCPRPTCLYQQLFEGETGEHRPSGYQEPPRPYVLRSRDWSERTIAVGERLVTGINLFDLRPAILDALLRAYTHLGEAGLGPGRARLALTRVPQPTVTILSLAPRDRTPSRVKARFLTPTEIKVGGKITRDAAFEPLFARLFERLRFLIRTHGETEVEIGGELDAAEQVITLHEDLRPAGAGVTRYSTRTHQTHPLSGFVGEAVYEGDFTLLWPWLKAAEWTGIGRQTVWGKGVVEWSGL